MPIPYLNQCEIGGYMISRNEPMGIVARTRKNLIYMRNARKTGADIHEVTHLLNSLLGLIVVPWEKLQMNILDDTFEGLERQGWPMPQVHMDEYPDKTETLKVLVNHLRNAVAHGRFWFEGIEPHSPDSREPSNVQVVMTDGSKKVTKWKAEINGEDLYKFCNKFIQHIENRLG